MEEERRRRSDGDNDYNHFGWPIPSVSLCAKISCEIKFNARGLEKAAAMSCPVPECDPVPPPLMPLSTIDTSWEIP